MRTRLAGFADAPFGHETKSAEVAVADAHLLAHMASKGTFGPWIRVTVGLAKRDGRQLITRSNGSLPFYVDDAGRAALDLSPRDRGLPALHSPASCLAPASTAFLASSTR